VIVKNKSPLPVACLAITTAELADPMILLYNGKTFDAHTMTLTP